MESNPIIPEFVERQIILYTKGHFKQTDIISDLKTIIAKCTGLEHISERDVYRLLIDIVFDYMDKEFIKYYLKYMVRTYNKENIIKIIVDMISHMRVRNGNLVLVYLGDPDYSILPPPEHK